MIILINFSLLYRQVSSPAIFSNKGMSYPKIANPPSGLVGAIGVLHFSVGEDTHR